MNMLRVLLVVLLGLALCAALQLPDPIQNTPEVVFADLPLVDWGSMAAIQWKADQAGAAILLLDYVIENDLPNAAVAAGLRDEYLTSLRDNSTPAGQMEYFGHPIGEAPDDHYGGLAGLSVADYFMYGHFRGAFDEWPKVNSADRFLALLKESGSVSSLFPPAEPALALLKVAKIQGALRATLAQQMTDALTFIKSAANTPLAMMAIQESIMPVYQLAKKCKTWTEFETLIRGAGSVDQIKVLTRMASSALPNAKKMAQILAVAGPNLSARCIGFAIRNGQRGLDALHVGVRKGAPGLQLVLAHPGVSAQTLANARRITLFQDTPILAWWQAQQARYGRLATLAKYAGVTLLCVGLSLSVMPQRIFRRPFHSAGPLSEEAKRRVNIYYWVSVFTVSLSIGLLLLLRSVSPPAAGPAENLGFTSGAGGVPIGHSGIATEDTTRTPPLLILMSVILIVQGACWWAARQKIQEVEKDPDAAAAEKLKRLENLDIFFDLPLYCGLALTICAFILITTFGAGVSRFLAYSATFVGIVCSVILRIGFLYPLREKLILRKEG